MEELGQVEQQDRAVYAEVLSQCVSENEGAVEAHKDERLQVGQRSSDLCAEETAQEVTKEVNDGTNMGIGRHEGRA